MEKILDTLKRQTAIIMLFRGGVYGLIIWVLHILIFATIGLKPLYYNYIGEFIIGGMIIGATIGLAVSANKEKKSYI
ncbi:hypothetical protein GF340_00580 [Candidatus Peregrinibacteria bacterium]|nr:hypothetical protein [Candidatus Peregrinibacteria bacterium]